MSAGVALMGALGMFFLLETFPAFGLISVVDVGMLLIVDVSMFLHILNWSFDVISVRLVVEHLSLWRACVSSQPEDDSSCGQAHQGDSDADRHKNVGVDVAVAICVGVVRVIGVHAADAGCSGDLISAAGCCAGREGDVEVEASACDAYVRAIWRLVEIVVLFDGDGFAADWSNEVLLGKDSSSVGLGAGELRKIVRERIEVRLPGHFSAYARVGLVNDGEHEVLAGVVAALHPEVGRTGGNSDLIAVNEAVEVDIDDLLAEVVLNKADQCG